MVNDYPNFEFVLRAKGSRYRILYKGYIGYNEKNN